VILTRLGAHCVWLAQEEVESLNTRLASLRDEKQSFEQQVIAIEKLVQQEDQRPRGVEFRVEALVPGNRNLTALQQQHGGPTQAMNSLLLASQSERDELAAVLTACEEQNKRLKAQAETALQQASQSKQLSAELREQLHAAEVRLASPPQLCASSFCVYRRHPGRPAG
jgi:chromosome segregation ATPase